MRRVLSWLALIVSFVVIIGSAVMLFYLLATTVGLTEQEQLMLSMTSAQINAMYAQSVVILNTLQSTQNFTAKLALLEEQLFTIQGHQASNNASTQILADNAAQLESDLLAYNVTIEPQLSVIQTKIDNVTLPMLNLTLDVDTATLGNGTVTWLNPNNALENTTLVYVVKSQLGSVYVELETGSLNYNTVGGMNWAALVDWAPPIFTNTTTVSGAAGQVLDDQRGKITATPPIGARQYFANEVRLLFDGAVGGAQTLTLTEKVEFNVGFI